MVYRRIGLNTKLLSSNRKNNLVQQSSQKWLPLSQLAVGTQYSAEYLSLLARRHKLVARKVDNVWHSTRENLDVYAGKQVARLQAEASEDDFLPLSKLSSSTPYTTEYLSLLARKHKFSARKIDNVWHSTSAELGRYIRRQQDRVSQDLDRGVTGTSGQKFYLRNLAGREEEVIYRQIEVKSAAPKYFRNYEDLIVAKLPKLKWTATSAVFSKVLMTMFVAILMAQVGSLFYAGTVGRSLSGDLENRVARLALASNATASLLDAINDSVDFFTSGFANLRDIALGRTDSTALVTAEPLPGVQLGGTPQAVVQSTPTLAPNPSYQNLRTELESYIRSQISQLTQPSAPITYNTTYSPIINTTILREEILLADTRPSITRQSSSDSDNRVALFNSLSTDGVFTNPTLTGATVSGTSGNFTNFTFGSATGTSATTTNFFATTASSTNLFSSLGTIQSLTFSSLTGANATTSTFAITGDGAGLTFYGSGNHDITAVNGTLRIGSNTIMGHIEALDNTIDIGTPGVRFDKIYADEVNASTIVGTLTGGNLTAETMNINSDNTSADTEDSYLSFDRGSLAPNALLRWNSTDDRFEFNNSLLVSGNSTTTNATTTSLFSTTASSTNLFSSLLSVGGSAGLNVIAGGNVGIGTTTPNFKLDVDGIVNATAIYENGAPFVGSQWTTSGSDIYYDDGDVGIGTADPLGKLHVNNGRIVIGGTSGGTTVAPAGTHTFSHHGSGQLYLASEYGAVKFSIGGGNNFNVETSGIATYLSGEFRLQSSAGGMVSINGDGTISNTLQLGNDVNGAAVAQTIKSHDGITGNNISGGDLILAGGRGTGSGTPGILQFQTSSALGSGATAQTLTTRMVINGSGNVGIGTTTPGSKLSVSGGVSIGANYGVAAPTNGLIVEGNVGIGVTSPIWPLDVGSGTGRFGGIRIGNSNSEFGTLSYSQGGTNTMTIGNAYDTGNPLWGNIDFKTRNNALTAMTIIGTTGKIGIGTTTPPALLSINDPAGIDSFYIGSSTPKLIVKDSGNVGIGTANPGEKLEVSGNIKLSATYPAVVGITAGDGITMGFRGGGYGDILFSSNAWPAQHMTIGSNGGTRVGARLASNATFGWGNMGSDSRPDPDVAFSRISAGVLALGTGAQGSIAGTMIVDKLGIGTTSPVSKLAIHANSGENNTSLFTIASSTQIATTTLFHVLNNGKIGVGTSNPEVLLSMLNGGTLNSTSNNNHYRNVATYSTSGGTTGTVKIVMPKLGSNTNILVTIRGFNYTANQFYGNWEVNISGRNFDSTQWHGYGAEISGKAPFTTVRLASDGTNNIILLGTTATTWSESSIVVTDVITSGSNFSEWGTGWTISRIASETGIVNIHDTSAPGYGQFQFVTRPTTVPDGNNTTDESLLIQTQTTRLRIGLLDQSAFQSIPNDRPAYIQTSFSGGGVHYSLLLNPLGGNVGVGTTTPRAKFTIYDSSARSFTLTDFTQNNDKAMLSLNSLYTDGAYDGGIFWSTPNDNALKPKAGIWTYYAGAGSKMLFGTSNSYSTGITNTAMTIDQNGRVGVGTTTPWAQLSVNPDGATGPAFVVGSSTGTSLIVTNGGNLGIGTKSPTRFVQIDKPSGNAQLGFYTNGTERAVLTGDTSGNFILDTGGNPRFTMSSSGRSEFLAATGGTFNPSNFGMNFKFGGSSAQYGMQFLPVDSTGTSLALFFANSSGSGVGSIQTTNTATAYVTSSDRRLKENIVDSEMGLESLLNIKVRDYEFIHDPDNSVVQGFVAQELYEIYPQAVGVGGDDPALTPWAVDYGKLTPLLTRAIQEVARITGTFKNNLIAWFADTANGIGDFFANRVRTKELCIGDESGVETCISKSQLDALLASAGSSSSSSGSISAPETVTESDPIVTTEEVATSTDSTTTESITTEPEVDVTTEPVVTEPVPELEQAPETPAEIESQL